MEPRLLILDDLADRAKGFASTLSALPIPPAWQLASTSAEFLSLAREHADHVYVVSLDHDLDPSDDLDGLDVVRAIVEHGLLPDARFIIHSSNSDRAAIMAGELELDGRVVRLVGPFGECWMNDHWIQVVMSLMDDCL